MPFPKEAVTRDALVAAARRLLVWLAGLYVDRVLVVDGHDGALAVPDGIIEPVYDGWDELLREAPAELVKANALRLIVEEAIAESQLRQAERFAPRLGRTRAVELLRDFGLAVDRTRFASTRGQRFRAWLSGALRLPPLAPTGSTPEDERLRARIDALTEDERLAATEFEISTWGTLRDLSPLCALPSLRTLDVSCAPLLVDLSPLTALTRLEELRLGAPTLRDLSPLARMPTLRRLVLDADDALDLAPLRSLAHLEELWVTGCDDLSPIGDLPSLRKLAVSARHTTPNLEPVGKLIGLRELSLHGVEADPAGIVGSLSSLVSLDLTHCEALTDLGPLAQLTELETLDLGMSPVTDLVPLRFLPKLRVLGLFGTAIRSWPPLRDLPHLEELNVMCTHLTGFAGVEHGLSLRKLSVCPSEARGFADLGALANLTRLEDLHLDGLEHLSDLSPLRGLAKLRRLHVGDSAVRDLTPLAALVALEYVSLPGTAVESVEPLAGLPKLRFVALGRCDALRSVRPLAACPALKSIECEDCEALTGPTSLEELRAPPPEPRQAKRFPSAGPATTRPGTVAAFDARGHLPKRPPEGWSLPEREPADEGFFWIEAEHSARIALALLSRDDEHLLMVHLWRHDRTRMADKQVARILRRFRAADSFVESSETMVDDVPDVRCFIALAHATGPDTWGAWRARAAFLRVEAGDAESSAHGAPTEYGADVRHHLPSPLPADWSTRATTKEPEDVACYVSAPDTELTVLLRASTPSDAQDLVVSLLPAPGRGTRYVSDETARALLGRFRGRGAFEETRAGPFARLPGMRIFVAPVKGGGTGRHS